MYTQTTTETIAHAKKRHMCDWCGQGILPNESYKRWRWFEGGDAGTAKLHPECYQAMNEMSNEDLQDGFSPGDSPRGCNCGWSHCCERCKANNAQNPAK